MTELYEVFRAYNQSLCKNLPGQEQTKSISFSKKFRKNAKRIVRHYGKFYYPIIKTAFGRVLIWILAISLLLGFVVYQYKSKVGNYISAPKGYSIISQTEQKSGDETIVLDGNGGEINIERRYNKDGKIIVDTDYLFFEEIRLKVDTALYFERAEHKGIRVIRGKYTYIITAPLDFDKNELISIAESVK